MSQITARYAEIHDPDLTVQDAAKRLGVTPRSIQRARAALGISRPNPRARPISPELHARIGQMVEDGCSIREIERTLGTTWQTVTRYYPGSAWSWQDVGRYAATVRKLGHQVDERLATR